MRKLKIYVGAAINGASPEFKQHITEFKEKLRKELDCEILDFVTDPSAQPAIIYQNDIVECVKSEADVIVADISYTSTGLGYEMGTMIEACDKPVIGLCWSEVPLPSKLIRGIPKNFTFDNYMSLDDMVSIVKKRLAKINFSKYSHGKLIALYGINNLGKSTQAKLIVERLNEQGIQTEYLKYALYKLEPSGPILNGYLREKNPWNLTPREFQILQVLNRTQYNSILQQKLESGVTIVAEDYVGTGIAWGMGVDIDFDFLAPMNQHLLKPDVSFLFYGERFSDGIEKGHKHESDDVLTQKVATIHDQLGERYGWERIHANQPISVITEELLAKIALVPTRSFEYWK